LGGFTATASTHRATTETARGTRPIIMPALLLISRKTNNPQKVRSKKAEERSYK
jgi:hypothetical protein